MKKEQETALELLRMGYAELAAYQFSHINLDMINKQIRDDNKAASGQLHDLINGDNQKKMTDEQLNLDGIIILDNQTDVEEEGNNQEPDMIGDAADDENPEIKKAAGIEDEYMRHAEIYRQFMSSQYQQPAQKATADYEYNTSDDSGRAAFAWGDEIISYSERKVLVKKMMVNSIMHGEHNPIDPRKKDAYKFWKYASKFNFLMSTLMYDKALNMN